MKSNCFQSLKVRQKIFQNIFQNVKISVHLLAFNSNSLSKLPSNSWSLTHVLARPPMLNRRLIAAKDSSVQLIISFNNSMKHNDLSVICVMLLCNRGGKS